ncbi:hypothetical protein [Lichenifustis flavocetrariae]|nr:hypothetical protein [Lichenifustis flavocetrariae]
MSAAGGASTAAWSLEIMAGASASGASELGGKGCAAIGAELN